MFSPGIEPGTFCVLDRCDNRYTTKTPCSQWQDGSKQHISSGTSRAVLTFVLHMPCADAWRLTAVIVQWLGPCVVAAVTQVRILVTAYFAPRRTHTEEPFSTPVAKALSVSLNRNQSNNEGCYVTGGYSSVVEQSAAVRQVHGSNPCVPQTFIKNFFSLNWETYQLYIIYIYLIDMLI